MNPFFNPMEGLPFLKSYLLDPGRVFRSSPKQIQKYIDHSFKKIVNYAYQLPIYHDKYKDAGVHPKDIYGIKDIAKLPFISKKDFMDNFPDGVIPRNYDVNKGAVLSTSGSTGKPVSFYIDFATTSKSILTTLRQPLVYNFKWRKTKYVSIGNFSPGKADNVVNGIFHENSSFLWNLEKSYRKMNAFDDIKAIIKKLNDFQPDYMLSYPVTFQQLAYFKRKGELEKVNPKIIAVSGYKLDEYTRNYVKDAFECPVVDIYTSAESIGDISFECLCGTYHVNYDFYHIEGVDENLNIVAEGEPGHVVFTRLYGKGTPFIRYTGLDDWVTIVNDYDCECGLRTPIFKNGVEGRRNTSVVLPDGQVIPAASFAIVSLILKDLKTFKVKQFQIIQNKIDNIDILLVIDEDLRDVGPSVDLIIKKIKEAYEEKCGPKVKITVKEIKEIKSPPGKPPPLVISKVKIEDGLKIIESK